MRQIINQLIKNYIVNNTKRRLKKVDKKICSLHNEWANLDKEELKIYKDRYAYKAFKNIYGKGHDGFVSDIVYQTQILPRLNFTNYSKDGRFHKHTYFDDKNYQEWFIKEIKPLQSVVHNVNGVFFDSEYKQISKDRVFELMNSHSNLVYKKAIETGHGKDVSLIKKEAFSSIIDGNDSDYIIQEVLRQHKSLAYYNSSSVNVIRITTLFLKGEIYVLGGVLRIGAPGAFCDHRSCGEQYPLVVAIHENGNLGSKAIDCDRGYVYDNIYGKEIKGQILKYEEMKELVKNEHSKYPNHGIIGWDLTLDENEDIRCIEFNVRCPGIVQSQYALGPIFTQKAKSGKTIYEEIMSL